MMLQNCPFSTNSPLLYGKGYVHQCIIVQVPLYNQMELVEVLITIMFSFHGYLYREVYFSSEWHDYNNYDNEVDIILLIQGWILKSTVFMKLL